MKKEDVLARIGQGPLEYKGFGKIKFYVEPSEAFPGEFFLHGMVMSESPYSDDAGFGGCFLSDVTDEDCEKLDALFESIREKMRKADDLARTEPLELKEVHTGNGGGPFYRTPEMDGKPGKTLAFEDWNREDQGINWFYLYVVYQGENDYAFGRPVILDGQVYRPIYSFWLEHSYYDRNHPEGLLREKENGGAD